MILSSYCRAEREVFIQIGYMSVANPGFSRRGGRQPQRGRVPTYYLANLPEKCMEITKIGLRGGSERPLDPPKYVHLFSVVVLKKGALLLFKNAQGQNYMQCNWSVVKPPRMREYHKGCYSRLCPWGTRVAGTSSAP